MHFSNIFTVSCKFVDFLFLLQHNRYVSEAKEKEPEVIMIGDSIIQHLEHVDYWNKAFAPMHTLNFGIGGDETQHVLWRMVNGELDNVKPKV